MAADDLVPSELAVDPRQALMELIVDSRRQVATPVVVVREDEGQRLRIEHLSAELDAIRSSASWRLTAPLRRGMTRLLRVRQALRATARTVRGEFLQPPAPVAAAAPGPEHAPDVGPAPSIDEGVRHPAIEPARRLAREGSIALPLPWARPAPGRRRIAVVAHLGDAGLAHELRRHVASIGDGVDVDVSTDSEFQASLVRRAFEGWAGTTVRVRHRERGVASQLAVLRDVCAGHEYVLYLQCERSRPDAPFAPWRQFMLETLAGNRQVVDSILGMMDESPLLGMVGVQPVGSTCDGLEPDGDFELCQALVARSGSVPDRSAVPDIPAGAMFWVRAAALAPLLDLPIGEADPQGGPDDAWPSQAIGWLCCWACGHAGYRWLQVARPEFHGLASGIESIPTPDALREWIEQQPSQWPADAAERPRDAVSGPVGPPTEAFIREIQQSAMGARGARSPSRRVAIGMMSGGESPAEFARAVDAARIAMGRCRSDPAGRLYAVNSMPSASPPAQGDAFIRQLESLGVLGFGAAHNRSMSAAFADGATHYVAVDPRGRLHPEAVAALVDMVEAQGDRALVEALRFPREHPKVYDAFDFETPWVSAGCLAIPRAAFELLGGFDERLAVPCADVDLSWRARAAGLSLKTCPRALFLDGVADREQRASTSQEMLSCALRLARKWDAPASYEAWIIARMEQAGMEVPVERPEQVPVQWKRYADFEHQLVFAPSRWTSDD